MLRAFAAQRKYLIVTTKAKKPDIQSSVYMEILKELQSMMGAVNDIREANRASPLFTHLTTVSEGITVLAWITIEPKPADYVTEVLSSAQFYGNRIIKEYKERSVALPRSIIRISTYPLYRDRKHVEWVNAFYNIFKSLTTYVKQHYPSGVTWNNQNGIDPQEALRQVQSGQTPQSPQPSASSAAPPPPPPLPSFDGPPPPPPMPANGPTSQSSSSDMGAVFDQISRGSDVTSGLRKVDKSEMTHKNPSLRATAPVSSAPARSSSQTSSRGKSPMPSKKPKPENMRTKKPPRKELEGNKWLLEYYDNPGQLVEIDAAISHSILISRCTKTTIRVIGKANAISLDNCTQCSLVIDSLVSAVDVIKSPKFEMQVLGMLPTIMLDQVDGAAIYLSQDSLATEIFTSKCTGVNVNLPGQSEDDDYVEKPLPEQLKSQVRNGVLTTEIVEHAG